MSWLSEGARKVGGWITGGSKDAGIAGVGQYKADEYDYDEGAFKNRNQTNYRKQDFVARRNGVLGRQDPTMATSDTRQNQMNLAQALEQQAAGKGPSLAQDQLQRATDANIASSMAMAASSRGISPAMANRQAMMQQAAAQRQAGVDSSTLRLQEQMQARKQLGGVLGGIRQQDIARNQANLESQLRTQALKDEMERYYSGQIGDIERYDANRAMELERLRGQQRLGTQQVNQQSYEGASNRRADFLGGLGQGLAAAFSDENQKTSVKNVGEKDSSLDKFLTGYGKKDTSKESAQTKTAKSLGEGLGVAAKAIGPEIAAAFSDKNNKKDMSKDDKKVKDFLDKLQAYQYKYKNPDMPGAGEGEYISPMAQDLEKSDIGKNMVMDTPQGKMVDYGKAGGTFLASAAMLNERMNELEKVLKKRKAS